MQPRTAPERQAWASLCAAAASLYARLLLEQLRRLGVLYRELLAVQLVGQGLGAAGPQVGGWTEGAGRQRIGRCGVDAAGSGGAEA
jgi:hypothetical protein